MKKIVVLLLIIIMASCTSNTIFKKPDNLIPKDTMELLMADMIVATAAKYTKNKSSEKDINYMPFVYEKYKIDSARLEKSNTYYVSKIDDYKKLMKAVRVRLEDIKDSLVLYKKHIDSIQKDSLKRLDTIRKRKTPDIKKIRKDIKLRKQVKQTPILEN